MFHFVAKAMFQLTRALVTRLRTSLTTTSTNITLDGSVLVNAHCVLVFAAMLTANKGSVESGINGTRIVRVASNLNKGICHWAHDQEADRDHSGTNGKCQKLHLFGSASSRAIDIGVSATK